MQWMKNFNCRIFQKISGVGITDSIRFLGPLQGCKDDAINDLTDLEIFNKMSMAVIDPV